MPAPRDITTVRSPGPHAPDRRCAEPGCITVLNRWHEGDRCYQHAPPERVSFAESKNDLIELMEAA